jgi:hypothetical protein
MKLPDFLCHSAPKLVPKSEENPYLCSGPDDTCLYEAVSPIKMDFELTCECGLNNLGLSFCPKIFKKKYTKQLAEVIETFG